MHDDVKKIGEILRAAREAKKMTQVALCKLTGIAQRTLIDIESGKRHPTYEVFYKIIHALDLSAEPEQEQLIRAIAACNLRDKAIFMEMAWAFVRASERDNNSI